MLWKTVSLLVLIFIIYYNTMTQPINSKAKDAALQTCGMTSGWIEKTKKVLRHDEGVRFQPYRDTVGKLTIGVGRNLDDVGISDMTVDQMLEEDICKAVSSAKAIFGGQFDTMTPLRQIAIVNMLFNLGEPRFKRFVMTIAAIKRNDFKSAKDHALHSRWAKQVGARAQRVVSMLEENKDIYPS